MYVEISAKTEDNLSRGKTTWLNTGDRLPSFEVKTDRAHHLGQPDWYVQLLATGLRSTGTGERGGAMRDTAYRLEAHITPADMVALVEFAIRSGLVKVNRAGQVQAVK